MDVIEAIKNRRSIRSFLPRPVSPVTVQDLLELAVLAPSSRNRQPWSFWIFLDRTRIEVMAQQVKEWLFKVPHTEPFTSPLRTIIQDPAYNVFYGAPALILVAATSRDEQAREDCCLATENMLLGARSLDLGTCIIGTARPWFNLPCTMEELGIPESYSVVAPVVLGYPSEWSEMPERKRPEEHWCALPYGHKPAR